MSDAPLDDIRTLIATLPGRNEQALAEAAAALSRPGTLGRLEELALWMAAWSGKAAPKARRPILALYAGAPGAGALDVSAERRERLEAVAAGAAPASLMAVQAGAGVEAFDLAIDRPITDFTQAPTLGERECAATIAFGMEVLAKQPDLLLVSEIGPLQSAHAAALASFLFPGDVDAAPADRTQVDAAIARFKAEGAGDALDALRHLGNREIAAAAGAILGARIQFVPVLLDGLGPCAAAAALEVVRPGSTSHCRLAQSVGPLASHMGQTPLLELDLAESDGTAALAALSLVRAACAILGPGG